MVGRTVPWSGESSRTNALFCGLHPVGGRRPHRLITLTLLYWPIVMLAHCYTAKAIYKRSRSKENTWGSVFRVVAVLSVYVRRTLVELDASLRDRGVPLETKLYCTTAGLLFCLRSDRPSPAFPAPTPRRFIRKHNRRTTVQAIASKQPISAAGPGAA